jgi:hypothetical protein
MHARGAAGEISSLLDRYPDLRAQIRYLD